MAQHRPETADAQASEGGLDPVNLAGALADQTLMLAGRAFRVLLFEGGHRGHAAVPALTTQPTQDSAFEQLGVEPVRLGAPVLAGHGNAGRVDHVRLDVMRTKPARQPEPVAAGLEGKYNALDRAASLGRLVATPFQALQKRRRVGWKLLERVSFDAGDDPGHEPAQLAHVDDRDQGAVLFKGNKGPAQAVQLKHGSSSLIVCGSDYAANRYPPHSFYTSA